MTVSDAMICNDCGWTGSTAVWRRDCKGFPCELGSRQSAQQVPDDVERVARAIEQPFLPHGYELKPHLLKAAARAAIQAMQVPELPISGEIEGRGIAGRMSFYAKHPKRRLQVSDELFAADCDEAATALSILQREVAERDEAFQRIREIESGAGYSAEHALMEIIGVIDALLNKKEGVSSI